jgi:hypothetical protein
MTTGNGAPPYYPGPVLGGPAYLGPVLGDPARPGTAYAGTAPPPPPGPGVQAPFVAPPTDGARQRRGWAVGLTIGTVLVCCVGSLVGSGGLLVLGSRMVIDSTKVAVTRYLESVRVADYEAAYGQLCQAEQRRRSKAEFTQDVRDEPRIASFQVDEPVIDNSERIEVPATLRYVSGATEGFVFYVVQDASTAEFEVCGRSG